ncbi:hypothetical protein [Endozoicomonas ascidiicola]|uniref:hypothetical protein n=1 Tax=Endozoicomonas ascidiicola TaxID=1698521 RepID=UPI00083436A4|nr:hypothetical protein [Endozoicomonas ascidiicola]
MTKFYLPVCSENLVKFLTYGLISADRTKPLSGRNSYVPDALSSYNGEIPLFIDKVPSNEIKKIKEFDKYLHAAILEIDLKKITSGSFKTNHDTSGTFPLSKLAHKETKWISIVGPIPITLINVVYFADLEAKDDFLSNFKSANIAPSKKIELWKEKLLDDSDDAGKDLLGNDQNDAEGTLTTESLMPQRELTTEHWHTLSAYGGALALAFSASKNGHESSKRFKTLAAKQYIENDDINAWDAGDDFAFICDFLLSSQTMFEKKTASFPVKLYAGILSHICATEEVDVTNALVQFLESDQFDNNSEAAKKMAEGLKTIHHSQYTGTASDHLSSIHNEIINNEKKSSFLGLGLAILTFKDNAEKVINYDQSGFKDTDYFYFSLLAGMRAGLHKIPSYIRNIDGMNEFLSTKMAQLAHRIIDSDLEFKNVKTPETIIDMIESEYSRKFHSMITSTLGLNGVIARKIKAADQVNIDMKLKEISIYDFKPEMVEITDTESYKSIMFQKKSKDILYNDLYKKLSAK